MKTLKTLQAEFKAARAAQTEALTATPSAEAIATIRACEANSHATRDALVLYVIGREATRLGLRFTGEYVTHGCAFYKGYLCHEVNFTADGKTYNAFIDGDTGRFVCLNLFVSMYNWKPVRV